VTKEEL
jgi:hypothetical protein